MNRESIPVFVIAFNRLNHLRSLIERLEQLGFGNIIIIDNASHYPPLLEFYAQTNHRVVRLEENFGHLALWKSGQFNEIINQEKFILTDCDVVPDESCPDDILEFLDQILERYPNFTKAGLSLRIDDLPDNYAFKQKVIEWELPFWEHKLDDGNYEGAVDTTFALYRPGIHCDEDRWWRSIRAQPPYSARHLPWYQDTSIVTEEDRYYQSVVKGVSTQWSITDPVLLKDQNTELQHELAASRNHVRALTAELERRQGYRFHLRQLTKIALNKFGLLKAAERILRKGTNND